VSEQERQVTTKLRRRNLAASLGRPALWILLALASISIFVLIVWKAPHFLWLLTDASDVPGVPVNRLPFSPSPAGAERYHVGSVSILLTPEWKNDVRTIKVMGGGLFFKSGQRELFVGLPQSYGRSSWLIENSTQASQVHRRCGCGLRHIRLVRTTFACRCPGMN
jgi:hypothetical protein